MSDGYALRGRVWPPAQPHGGPAVVYLHGIQSHGGWFEWSASLLAASGKPVILPDRRGSGMNEGARGDTPSAKRWLRDIDELAAWARSEFGVTSFDVVGVSWGGKLAAAWALRHPQHVSRLMLIAPGLFPAVDVGTWRRLEVALSLLAGGKRVFPIPLDDPALFTDSPAGLDFIAGDPLKLTQATARFFWHSRRLDRRLPRAPAGSLQAETTLLLAERDQIIRNGPTVGWLRRVASREPRVTTFPNAAHTLEFAADPTLFGKLIEAWGRSAGQASNP